MSRNDSRYHRLLNSTKWRSLRAAQLDREPFCADCGRLGVLTPADDVHHVIPVESEPDPERQVRMTFDPSNLVSLCRSCHIGRHRQMKSHSREEAQRRAKAEAEAFWKRFG